MVGDSDESRTYSLSRPGSDATGSPDCDAAKERDKLALVNRALAHDLLGSLNLVRARLSRGARDDADRTVDRRIEEMISRVETMRAITDAIVADESSELQAVDVRDVVRDEAEKKRRLHGDAEIAVGEIPETPVLADRRLPLVLENLLRNAIEHNDTESPSVRIAGARDGDRVTLTVEDDGPGIPDTYERPVFENGITGEDSAGTGFGLYFVQRTVDSYDGDVTIEEREPRGTAVRVTLWSAE